MADLVPGDKDEVRLKCSLKDGRAKKPVVTTTSKDLFQECDVFSKSTMVHIEIATTHSIITTVDMRTDQPIALACWRTHVLRLIQSLSSA